MKLPVKVSGSSITDADRKVVVTTTSANGDYWLSDFTTDAENDAHLAEIAAALNERDALRAKLAALARLANTALIFIDVFAADKVDDEYNRVLINPLKAAIAAAESEAANG